jgi:hypothetical protein
MRTHAVSNTGSEHLLRAELATINQDFTRVLFISNWAGSGAGHMHSYLFTNLPAGAPNALACMAPGFPRCPVGF